MKRTVNLKDGPRLLRLAVTFYRLCADRDSDLRDIQAVGRQLYLSFIQPFRNDFGSSQRLWIDLDPSLGMLPLAAMTTPEGRWFGDSMQISVLPPWWSLEPSSAFIEAVVSDQMRAIILNGFANIKSAKSETSEIGQLFPRSMIVAGTTASPSSVVQDVTEAEVFHFSGHATSASGPAAQFIPGTANSDSMLTPEALSGAHLDKCKLTMLAACNTTSADPDQVEWLPNLRSALLHSGVHTVVASNWDVDDGSTRSLVLAFYPNLLRGVSPSRALQLAQQSVHANRAWAHPYYWAAFETFTHRIFKGANSMSYTRRSVLRNAAAISVGSVAGVPFFTGCTPSDFKLGVRAFFAGTWLFCRDKDAGYMRAVSVDPPPPDVKKPSSHPDISHKFPHGTWDENGSWNEKHGDLKANPSSDISGSDLVPHVVSVYGFKGAGTVNDLFHAANTSSRFTYLVNPRKYDLIWNSAGIRVIKLPIPTRIIPAAFRTKAIINDPYGDCEGCVSTGDTGVATTHIFEYEGASALTFVVAVTRPGHSFRRQLA